MNTATKTGIEVAKTASKRIVQKTAETTGDLIENKIADVFRMNFYTKNGENIIKKLPMLK